MASLKKYKMSASAPFLRLQKHAILRSLPSTIPHGETHGKGPLFQKPREICPPSEKVIYTLWDNQGDFSKAWRKQIAQYISTYQLQIRLIKDSDTPRIQEFFSRRYAPAMAAEICSFDLFRIRNYGHGLILEDESGAVQGTIFEIGYDTPEKTSYTIRLGIAKEYGGKNLGLHLMQYSCLIAMEHGSFVKRGIIQAENLTSLYINLNKVGWICDKYEPHIHGIGAFFHIALPLSTEGLTQNTICPEKVRAFIQQNKEGQEYRLLDCANLSRIEQMYKETNFKIVALLKPGWVSSKAKFLAIGADRLNLETTLGRK